MELHGAAWKSSKSWVNLLGLDTDAQSWILFAKFVPLHATLLVNGGLYINDQHAFGCRCSGS